MDLYFKLVVGLVGFILLFHGFYCLDFFLCLKPVLKMIRTKEIKARSSQLPVGADWKEPQEAAGWQLWQEGQGMGREGWALGTPAGQYEQWWTPSVPFTIPHS